MAVAVAVVGDEVWVLGHDPRQYVLLRVKQWSPPGGGVPHKPSCNDRAQLYVDTRDCWDVGQAETDRT